VLAVISLCVVQLLSLGAPDFLLDRGFVRFLEYFIQCRPQIECVQRVSTRQSKSAIVLWLFRHWPQFGVLEFIPTEQADDKAEQLAPIGGIIDEQFAMVSERNGDEPVAREPTFHAAEEDATSEFGSWG